MEVSELKKEHQKLNSLLEANKEGKVFVGSLDDKSNFANLIQKQATLIENLEQEKKRSKYLESKVKLNKSFDAGT